MIFSINIEVLQILTDLKFKHIFSTFTRSNGFTNLESTLQIPRRNLIHILNSFTPQGSSPKGSIRITSVDEFIGVGYYYMISPSVAKLSIFLVESRDIGLNIFTPPLGTDLKRIFRQSFNIKSTLNRYPRNWVYPVIEKFGLTNTSALLYSFLSGDNILIVHPSQETRLKFLGFFLNLLPGIVLKYNRITLGCSELDGNENIVGVDKLPLIYRSHKKLYLPLDTIFVDLISNTVEGEGVKRSSITDELVKTIMNNYFAAKSNLKTFCRNIVEESTMKSFEKGYNIESLIDRIEVKLNIKTPTKNKEWIMF